MCFRESTDTSFVKIMESVVSYKSPLKRDMMDAGSGGVTGPRFSKRLVDRLRDRAEKWRQKRYGKTEKGSGSGR